LMKLGWEACGGSWCFFSASIVVFAIAASIGICSTLLWRRMPAVPDASDSRRRKDIGFSKKGIADVLVVGWCRSRRC
jgi:hypothetical protein